MSTKRGRKCSIKSCDNFQHTHKYLSFFRFPKDNERCRTWIEKTQRFDLLGKTNVHDERICQQHFEPIMFLNESQNRLQQYAIPTLYLTSKPPSIQMPSFSLDELMLNGLLSDEHTFDKAKFDMNMINAAAALLHQNNLTITPVLSSKLKPPQSMPKQIQSICEPLNLSASIQTNTHSPNDSVASNKSFTSNGSPHAPITNHCNASHTPTNGSIPVNNTIVNTINATNAGGFRRPRQVFTMEQENQLADYVRETSNYYSGLSSKEVRILAFVYGVCNQVEMPNGWRESHQASFDWIVGFIKRTKLPPTMITGISSKGSGSGKQSKSSSSLSNEQKPKKTVNHVNGNSESVNNSTINVTPIEID